MNQEQPAGNNLDAMNTQQFLDTPLAMLGFSEMFTVYAETKGWKTLRNIVEIPLARLVFNDGLPDLCFKELTSLLVKHHRLHLLKVNP